MGFFNETKIVRFVSFSAWCELLRRSLKKPTGCKPAPQLHKGESTAACCLISMDYPSLTACSPQGQAAERSEAFQRKEKNLRKERALHKLQKSRRVLVRQQLSTIPHKAGFCQKYLLLCFDRYEETGTVKILQGKPWPSNSENGHKQQEEACAYCQGQEGGVHKKINWLKSYVGHRVLCWKCNQRIGNDLPCKRKGSSLQHLQLKRRGIELAAES